MKTGEFLSIREAATRLGIGLSALYPAVWTGRIAAHKVAGRWLIPQAAVAQRLAQRKAKNAARAVQKTKGPADSSRTAQKANYIDRYQYNTDAG